ncbi:hypothetical protein HJG60_011110 [Phyllostomus discolor]|uniref:Uncharacterized protein n=1 Tax=Phyllostomus discolor TaxID=89673 RepID=A0A834E541_9CHIR|nr:hypothetical protein HJG60_011110 [Phyllostomus discolor]
MDGLRGSGLLPHQLLPNLKLSLTLPVPCLNTPHALRKPLPWREYRRRASDPPGTGEDAAALCIHHHLLTREHENQVMLFLGRTLTGMQNSGAAEPPCGLGWMPGIRLGPSAFRGSFSRLGTQSLLQGLASSPCFTKHKLVSSSGGGTRVVPQLYILKVALSPGWCSSVD